MCFITAGSQQAAVTRAFYTQERKVIRGKGHQLVPLNYSRHHQEPQGARTRPRTSILVTLEKRVSPGAHATGSGRSQSTTQPRTRFQSRDVIPQLPRPSAPPAPPDRWCVSRSDEEDGFSSGCSNRTLFFLVLLCAPRGPHLPSLLATESRIPACAEVRAFNCHCIRRCGA